MKICSGRYAKSNPNLLQCCVRVQELNFLNHNQTCYGRVLECAVHILTLVEKNTWYPGLSLLSHCWQISQYIKIQTKHSVCNVNPFSIQRCISHQINKINVIVAMWATFCDKPFPCYHGYKIMKRNFMSSSHLNRLLS